MENNYENRRILVLGLSKSGVSAAKFLKSRKAQVWVSEYSQTLDEQQQKDVEELQKMGVYVEWGGHSEDFASYKEFAVISPGISPDTEIYKRLKEKKTPIISEIELAYKNTKIPFVAITGTNGKTTTTALTSHILEFKNKGVAPVCGNIGIAPTSLLDNTEGVKYFVCEVSSYQAENSPTFKPLISCYLNFTPDHISWHGSLENYFNAKAKLFASYKKPAFAVLNALDENVCKLANNFKPDEVFYFGKEKGNNCSFIKDEAIYFKRHGKAEKIIELKDIPMVGEHNYQNVMCSLIAAKILGLDTETIKEAIKEFEPPKHRCEFCVEKKGIKFYNDSKGTNPESTIVAIKSFTDKKVTLIAGGRDKNTSLDEFCQYVKNYIADVILIGEATQRFDENLKNSGYTNIHYAETLEEAIDKSVSLKNEICLFSPACASFDMFKNFEQRGDVFREYVKTKI